MLCSLAEELYDVHSFGGSVGWLVINDVFFGGIYFGVCVVVAVTVVFLAFVVSISIEPKVVSPLK